jgi:hypothetical protein
METRLDARATARTDEHVIVRVEGVAAVGRAHEGVNAPKVVLMLIGVLDPSRAVPTVMLLALADERDAIATVFDERAPLAIVRVTRGVTFREPLVGATPAMPAHDT